MGMERRKSPRLSLRLGVVDLTSERSAGASGAFSTTNVSAGGILFNVPNSDAPPKGSEFWFELVVPPGEGYSACGGSIKGSGRVLRTAPLPDNVSCVAVEFSRPLAMEF